MKLTNKWAATTILLPHDLQALLRSKAQSSQRSIGGQIRHYLEGCLRKELKREGLSTADKVSRDGRV